MTAKAKAKVFVVGQKAKNSDQKYFAVSKFDENLHYRGLAWFESKHEAERYLEWYQERILRKTLERQIAIGEHSTKKTRHNREARDFMSVKADLCIEESNEIPQLQTLNTFFS